MKANKREFEVEVDGKAVKLAVKRPDTKTRQDGQRVYAKAYADFVKAGAILKQKLESVAREQKLWDDERQNLLEKVSKSLDDNEKVVTGRVKGTTLKSAREAAIQMRRDRRTLLGLLADSGSMDSNTVEGLAEQEQFTFFVAACTVYADTGKPYFRNVDDYVAQGDGPVGASAASNFAILYYNYNPEDEKKRPENAFLLKYKLCDDELRLLNEKGRLVDVDGRLIDKDGRFINKDGELVDSEGNRVNEDGEPLTETFPFLDDEGKDVVADATVSESKEPVVETTAV